MSILSPGASRRAFFRLFGRKAPDQPSITPEKPLTPQEIAQLFNRKAAQKPLPTEPRMKPAEERDHENLTSLRQALYAKD
jgi:hypothetical protein